MLTTDTTEVQEQQILALVKTTLLDEKPISTLVDGLRG
jgi:hypothetical protein